MRPDTVTLAFDTSAAHCAAALLTGGRVAAARREEMARGQAERLFPMLEELLAEAGLAWSHIGLIGVGVGPGNFTGIRIAVSAARGLALSLGVRAIGVTGLKAQVLGYDAPAISSLSAPRGQVYAEAFPATGAGPVMGTADDVTLELSARSEPICIGAEAEVFARRFSGRVGEPNMPLAEAIARIAITRKNNATEGRPSPFYFRPADAAPSSDPPPVILP